MEYQKKEKRKKKTPAQFRKWQEMSGKMEQRTNGTNRKQVTRFTFFYIVNYIKCKCFKYPI